MCGSSIYKPLEIIFKQCIDTGVFPFEWEKGNIVPIHEKGDKYTLEDYCFTKSLASLLKIKLFHQISLVLNRVILALISCYLSLMKNLGLEVRSMFLDILKAFDKA